MRKTVRFPDVYDKTGEAIPVVAYIPDCKARGFGQIYRLLSTRVLEDFSTGDGRAPLGPILTIVALMDSALRYVEAYGPQNRAPVCATNAGEIAEKIGRSRRQVLRYLKELEELEYISRHGATSKQVIFLNPDMFYTGSVKQKRYAQTEFRFGTSYALKHAEAQQNDDEESRRHDEWRKEFGHEQIGF